MRDCQYHSVLQNTAYFPKGKKKVCKNVYYTCTSRFNRFWLYYDFKHIFRLFIGAVVGGLNGLYVGARETAVAGQTGAIRRTQ